MDTPYTIDDLYAVIGTGPDGSEGIACVTDETTGIMTPLVSGEKGVPRLLTSAKAIEVVTGIKFRLVKFTSRENMVWIE
jgi:hypothetical protein